MTNQGDKPASEMPPAWKPISEHPETFYDGATYLAALRVKEGDKYLWEFYTLMAQCDSETAVSFKVRVGEDWDYLSEWDWSDFEYYLVIEDYR